MEWLFWFSVLLFYLLVTERMVKAKSCLSQPDEVVHQETGLSVKITCVLSSDCSKKDWQYQWFSFKEKFHFRLKLQDYPLKYRLEGASLCIDSLHTNDSGIYHCAAASQGKTMPGTQYVGSGTTLVVTDKNKTTVSKAFLWVSCTLLFLYSLVVVTCIMMKYGCRRIKKTGKDTSSKKKQFHDVLQEMYRKGKLERKKQTTDRNSSQIQASSNDLNGSADDIYQNL